MRNKNDHIFEDAYRQLARLRCTLESAIEYNEPLDLYESEAEYSDWIQDALDDCQKLLRQYNDSFKDKNKNDE